MVHQLQDSGKALLLALLLCVSLVHLLYLIKKKSVLESEMRLENENYLIEKYR